MRCAGLVLLLILAAEACPAEKQCPQPLWTVDLATKYSFRPLPAFKHGWGPPPEMWDRQRGVVFISEEVLAVYQVLASNDVPPLGHRDPSGGGGRFVLLALFLDAKNGEEVRTLRLVTSGSDFSGVYPTHDGNFLVRTGRLLRLYSPAFQEIASRSIPPSPAENMSWLVSVVASGRRVYVEFGSGYGLQSHLWDADTLESIWDSPPGNTSDSGSQGSDYSFEDISCPGESGRIPGQMFVYNNPKPCKKLKLLSADGHLFWEVPVRDKVHSLLYNDRLLAVEIHRHRPDPFDLGIQSKPLRIALYDLATKSEKCSTRIAVPVSGWRSMFYALSPTGALAVIQGTKLSLYQP